MKIKHVDFAGAIANPGGTPPGDLPSVAMSGRSNVGKSSLINRLLGRTRTRIARVSERPGKTQEINFYQVRAAVPSRGDLDFYLVDLPGYGFARVPPRIRERWQPLIEGYLTGGHDLRGIVQLIDARHGCTAQDRKMVRYLGAIGVPTLVILTKIDKVKRGRRAARVRDVVEDLGIDKEQVLPFSSKTGEGRHELLASLGHLLAAEDAV